MPKRRQRTLPGLYWRADLGCWYLDKRVFGRRVSGPSGFGEGKYSEAESWALGEIERARLQAQAERDGRQSVTFRDCAARYLRENADMTSIATQAMHLQQLDPWIGAMPIEGVHDGTLRPFIAAMDSRPESDAVDGGAADSAGAARPTRQARRCGNLAQVWERTSEERLAAQPPPPELRRQHADPPHDHRARPNERHVMVPDQPSSNERRQRAQQQADDHGARCERRRDGMSRERRLALEQPGLTEPSPAEPIAAVREESSAEHDAPHPAIARRDGPRPDDSPEPD